MTQPSHGVAGEIKGCVDLPLLHNFVVEIVMK